MYETYAQRGAAAQTARVIRGETACLEGKRPSRTGEGHGQLGAKVTERERNPRRQKALMRLLLDTSVLRFANRRSWAGSEWFPALIFSAISGFLCDLCVLRFRLSQKAPCSCVLH